ncbi:hypothetical protein [Pseudomonas sp.]|uniref:hypothetical protein n=1 Tax=Pseudomonas sp. TaxID=306 RepID=UPI0028AECED7|nr:hypothetical protein [Pseudomonas sp.]
MPLNANASASALFVAALALISDYGSLAEQVTKQATEQVAEDSAEVLRLRGVITSLIQGWSELDEQYAKNVSRLATMTSLDDQRYHRNMELLKATRQLEETLKETRIPAVLLKEHNQFRRSVARVRSRMATMDMMYRQYFVKPEEFPTSLRSSDLIELAHHTTKRIAQIA